MAPSIHFTEPHPSIKPNKSRVIYSGRGGAGNYSRHTASELTSGPTATGPASRAASNPSASSRSASTPKWVSGGIGGAGNVRPAAERRMFSFDEELERQQRLADAANATPVYHVGRGGAGNAFANKPVKDLSFAEPSAVSKARQSSSASISSNTSNASREALDKAKRSFEGVRGRFVRALSRE